MANVKQLIDAFGAENTDWILRNPDVQYNGSSISIFDLTEEKNAVEALELLKQIIT